VAEANEHFSQQLTAELKRNRFGDPQKSKRAKKANRLPAGLSYTVSAVSAAVEEPVAGKYRYLTSTEEKFYYCKAVFQSEPNFDMSSTATVTGTGPLVTGTVP
jgi:hypothetical protein